VAAGIGRRPADTTSYSIPDVKKTQILRHYNSPDRAAGFTPYPVAFQDVRHRRCRLHVVWAVSH
jgi:hypothetical protein